MNYELVLKHYHHKIYAVFCYASTDSGSDKLETILDTGFKDEVVEQIEYKIGNMCTEYGVYQIIRYKHDRK